MDGLGLSKAQLSGACAVVVFPDDFDRREGSDILSLLLDAESLAFKAAICHEEAACAAFGAGVGSACVVDLGGQRATVCCVDEGMPMPGCRQILAYAGDDMDVFLHALLHRHGLAARLPGLSRPPAYSAVGYGAASIGLPLQAAMVLSKIRHTCCTLCLDEPHDSPSAAQVFGQPTVGLERVLRVHLGSLAHVPPFLLFVPSVASTLQAALTHSSSHAASR